MTRINSVICSLGVLGIWWNPISVVRQSVEFLVILPPSPLLDRDLAEIPGGFLTPSPLVRAQILTRGKLDGVPLVVNKNLENAIPRPASS